MTAFRFSQSLSSYRSIRSLVLAGSALWALGASGQAVAQSLSEGVWEGRYHCSQGPTGFTVEVTRGSKGRLRFYPLPENPGVPEGEYEIDILQRSFVEIELRPVRWIRQPPGYTFVPMRGAAAPGAKRLSGLVEAGGCANFVLTKVERSDPAAGAVPDSAKNVEPQTPHGARNAVGDVPDITKNGASQTTSPRHGLNGPDDFAAIGLNAKMSAADVFAHFSGDKRNDIYWHKTGIDSNCQGVTLLAAETIRSGQAQSDRRAFKLVTDQSFEVVSSFPPPSQCTIRFFGELLHSLSCYGSDRRDGNVSVLAEFIQRVGEPDSTAKTELGTRAEWRCSSVATQPVCKVVIEASEPSCIVAGAKTTCPQFKLSFERDYRPEQEKVNKQQALLRKEGGCVLEVDAGVVAPATARSPDREVMKTCHEKSRACNRDCMTNPPAKGRTSSCLECINAPARNACVAANGAQLCTSFGCW